MSQSSYANALVVALLTCPASSVVAEGFIPDDIIRSSHVMGPPSATAAYASVPIERSLRSNATSDDANSSEDRAGFAALAADLQNLPSKVSSEVKMSWLRFQSPSNRFKSLKFSEKKPDKLFANPKFLEWFNDVKSRYTNKPTKAFTKIYLVVSGYCEDEAALNAFLFAESKTKSAMSKDAGSLLTAQVNKWTSAGNDAASVYKLLKLDQTQVDNLFAHPAILQWNHFMDLRYKKKATVKMFETLMSENKNEDATVTMVLVEGKKIHDTSSIADRLLRYQVEHWKADDKNTAASVYELLKLDQTQVDNPFENPVFVQWALYVETTSPWPFGNRRKETAYEVIYKKLLIQCKDDDVAVAKALITGLKREDVKRRTADEMAIYWLVDGQLTGKENRKVVWLDQTASNDVEGKFKNIWDDYQKLFGRESRETFEELRGMFGDVKVACMLESATAVNAFKIPVQELRKAQFNLWKSSKTSTFPKKMLFRGIPDEVLLNKITGHYDKTLAAGGSTLKR